MRIKGKYAPVFGCGSSDKSVAHSEGEAATVGMNQREVSSYGSSDRNQQAILIRLSYAASAAGNLGIA